MTTAHNPKQWFLHDGRQQLGPFREVDLRKRLLGIADLSPYRVRQTNSRWHPAADVLKKFKQLSRNGIYLRNGGHVEGPFTAERALQTMAGIDLDGVTAKIGLSGRWVSAVRLRRRLDAAVEAAQQAVVLEAVVVDDPLSEEEISRLPEGKIVE